VRFVLTERHLKLLARAVVEWDDCETGAPAINPKRPYGNSYVAGDVAEILDALPGKCESCGHEPEDHELTAAQADEFLKLHRETEHALAIVLQHGLKPGVYVRDGWHRWECQWSEPKR
jgi:hypothetical protein